MISGAELDWVPKDILVVGDCVGCSQKARLVEVSAGIFKCGDNKICCAVSLYGGDVSLDIETCLVT